MQSTISITQSEINAINVEYYVVLISFTLLVYEYFLVLSREVDRFWTRNSGRPTWPVILFFFNRYFTLVGNVPVMFEIFWYSTAADKLRVCRSFQTYSQYFVLVVQISVSALMMIRVYALYERSWRVLVLFAAASTTVIVIACWSLFSEEGYDATKGYLLTIGCSDPVPRATAIRYGGAWAGALAFDILIFAMTVHKSLTLHRSGPGSLLALMLRDGSIYFGVMMVTNTANILTFLYGNVYTRGMIAMFMNVTSSVMVTRLMLNLRDPTVWASPQLEGSGVLTGASYQFRTPTHYLSTTLEETHLNHTSDDGVEDYRPSEGQFLHYTGKAPRVSLSLSAFTPEFELYPMTKRTLFERDSRLRNAIAYNVNRRWSERSRTAYSS